MSTDQPALKLEIKQWEHRFREKQGRNPTKEDIKNDTNIASKYKLYNTAKLKAQKEKSKRDEKLRRTEPLTPSKKHNTQFITPRKYKSKHREREVHLETPQKTSPIPPSPVVVELGPTPQLNGRVLSIFDMSTTYLKSTPLKDVPTDVQFDDHTVHTNKKLDFSGIGDSDDEDHSILSSPAPLLGEKDQTSTSQPPESEFKTPQKNRVVNYNIETPIYLRTSTLQTATASPSPLASQRIKKNLSTLFEELRDIQDELKYGDFEEHEIASVGSSSDEEPDNEEEEIALTEDKGQAKWKKKKRKGPKRQHRLVRIRALPSTEKLEVIDEKKDIKEQINKLVPVSEEKILESDESEDWSDGGNEYVREYVDFSKMKGKRKPAGVSKNFKAYKIQKSKFFGKRAKGW